MFISKTSQDSIVNISREIINISIPPTLVLELLGLENWKMNFVVHPGLRKVTFRSFYYYFGLKCFEIFNFGRNRVLQVILLFFAFL